MAWGWRSVTAAPAAIAAALNAQLPALASAFTALERLTASVGVIPDGATQPSVAGVRTWITRNTAPTSITAFREGRAGQSFILVVLDADTTLVHAASLVLVGGANVAVPANTALAFVTHDGSTWMEIGR